MFFTIIVSRMETYERAAATYAMVTGVPREGTESDRDLSDRGVNLRVSRFAEGP